MLSCRSQLQRKGARVQRNARCVAMSNIYNVGFHYTEFAKVQVKAKSQEEAESMVYEMLDYEGVPTHAKTFDRDYDVAYSEVCDG